MMTKLDKSKALALLFALIVMSTGCSGKQLSLEEELCDLYRAVNQQGIVNVPSKEGALAESIQSEIPDFFEEHYVNLVQVDWADRANMLETLLSALDESRSPGLCPSILAYYK